MTNPASPLSLRESLDARLDAWVWDRSDDPTDRLVVDVARLTLDAVEAEVKKELPSEEFGWAKSAINTLRAQLTVSPSPAREECQVAGASSRICEWGMSGCEVQHQQRAYANPTTITNAAVSRPSPPAEPTP